MQCAAVITLFGEIIVPEHPLLNFPTAPRGYVKLVTALRLSPPHITALAVSPTDSLEVTPELHENVRPAAPNAYNVNTLELIIMTTPRGAARCGANGTTLACGDEIRATLSTSAGVTWVHRRGLTDTASRL